MVYIYSDPHFYHEKIIDYTDRPFDNAEEMNEALIKNWNDVVNKDDKVFVLGDFGLGNKEQMKAIVKRLKGYIVP
jgi:calcineurin-like phosphoesterase family protein